MNDRELEEIAQQSELNAEKEFSRRLRKVTDFRYDEVQEKFWDITTGILLGARSVDGAIPVNDWPTSIDAKGNVKPIKPSVAINDIMTGLTVECSTWWPGANTFIQDAVITERGLIEKRGACTYNTYVGPDRKIFQKKNKKWPKPDLWIEHVKKLFPEPLEHEHFFDFAAHMIQRPGEKVNHGLVIAGAQGIGKDTAMQPLRIGVGQWNAIEIGPDTITEQYNGFLRSVLLIINEVRPHDEDHKASNFYNQLKPYLSAPPELLPMNLKYHNTIQVRNVCHVILTTNDPLTMYIPLEDRRLFVMTSPLPDPKLNKVFSENYFKELWDFMDKKGCESVIAWLLERDISKFLPGEPPAMTAGKRAIIESAHAVRRTLVDDVLESYIEQIYAGKRPDVIFLKDLHDFVSAASFFDDAPAIARQLNAKNFHFKMDERGYTMLRNPTSSEWKHGKYRSRIAFYAKGIAAGQACTVVDAALRQRPLSFADLLET